MPYISQINRGKFDSSIVDLSNKIETDGELNYCISKLTHEILIKKGLSYQNINSIIGALECAKLEFNRIVVGRYEDKKIKENGNISDLDKP